MPQLSARLTKIEKNLNINKRPEAYVYAEHYGDSARIVGIDKAYKEKTLGELKANYDVFALPLYELYK